jgi:hypothetical protein
MASKKNLKVGCSRHKDMCGLLKTWSGVAKGSVTPEDCKEVRVRVCMCVYTSTNTHKHTHKHKHTHTSTHTSTQSHSHVHTHTFTPTHSHTNHTCSPASGCANESWCGRSCWHSYGDQLPSSLRLRAPPPPFHATLVSQATRAHTTLGSVCGWRG